MRFRTKTAFCPRRSILLTALMVAGLLTAALNGPHASAADGPNCGGPGQVPCSTAKATFVGAKPKGCPKGSFFDPIDGGGCWTCPKGTVRGVTSVKSNSACLRGPGETTRAATRHSKGTGLLGTDCPRGQFWDPNRYCYSCPKGFTRTAAPVTAGNACTKWRGPSTTSASKKKSLSCPANSFFDPINKGSCWTCPKGFGRTLAFITADNACAANLAAGIHPLLGKCNDGLVNIRGRCVKRNECGALGQRPCTVTERLPSCYKGLAEDFVAHRCVEDRVGHAICKTTVDAIWAGQDLSGLLSKASPLGILRSMPVPASAMAELEQVVKDVGQKELGSRVAQLSPEAGRIVNWMNDPANASRVRSAFSSKNLCSSEPRDLDRMLLDMGLVPPTVIRELGLDRTASSKAPPSVFKSLGVLSLLQAQTAHAALIKPGDPLDRHFYMGYELTLSAAKVGGGGVSLMGVTDFRGNGGLYLAPLLQVVTNVTGDFDARVVFFSTANMQTFEGFGFSVGASGGIKGPAGAGVDFILDNTLRLRGFGIGPSLGKGKLPVDAGVQGAHAWSLERHCADADADTTTDCSACGCID